IIEAHVARLLAAAGLGDLLFDLRHLVLRSLILSHLILRLLMAGLVIWLRVTLLPRLLVLGLLRSLDVTLRRRGNFQIGRRSARLIIFRLIPFDRGVGGEERAPQGRFGLLDD